MQINWTCRVHFIPAFVFRCIMFISASCVIGLGLEVEAFGEAMCGCSSLEPRVRVDLIGQDCELETSEILLMVDPRGIASSLVWVHGMVIHYSW